MTMALSAPPPVRGARRRPGVLVTAAGPTMHDVLHDLALPTFHRFAHRWGYDVEVEALSTDGAAADERAQVAKWTKIRLLRQALERYPIAVWVDADILLRRADEDVADHLHPDHFQGLALEHVPYEHRVNPNTGVWVMRSEPRSFAFLDAVEQLGQQPGPWADQGAVLVALGWDRGDERYRWARPGTGNAFLAGTSWLPGGWNQPYVDGRDEGHSYNSAAASYADRPVVRDPHALHFMGMTPDSRYRHMAAALSPAAPVALSPTGPAASPIGPAALRTAGPAALRPAGPAMAASR